MTLDYFYGQAGELFSFYRIPKALFQEPRFQSLSTDAKTLYGILLDRMSLSVKNGWLDKQNRVFILFTIEDVKRVLCCADNKATKLLRELEKFGLIERKRRGQGKPSLVYVKNFSAESSKESVKMRYNPFAYIHEEKDILKLVTTLMTNTKGEGQGGDPFWDKAERLLLTSLIAYLHYEAPAEEQNFATLLEMLNTMQVSEDDEDYQNPVDLLFEDLAKKKPNSFAGRQYKLYKLAAGDVCSK